MLVERSKLFLQSSRSTLESALNTASVTTTKLLNNSSDIEI